MQRGIIKSPDSAGSEDLYKDLRTFDIRPASSDAGFMGYLISLMMGGSRLRPPALHHSHTILTAAGPLTPLRHHTIAAAPDGAACCGAMMQPVDPASSGRALRRDVADPTRNRQAHFSRNDRPRLRRA